MKFFLDTEFHERGPMHPIDLISIGVVAEDGREYYAQCLDADWAAIKESPDQWLVENVIPRLVWWDNFSFSPRLVRSNGRPSTNIWRTRGEIARDLVEFFAPSELHKPEIWGYFCDYDWVVLAQTFGRMVDLPNGMPMWCRDVKQLADSIGVEYPGRLISNKNLRSHNALDDAKKIKLMYEALVARTST